MCYLTDACYFCMISLTFTVLQLGCVSTWLTTVERSHCWTLPTGVGGVRTGVLYLSSVFHLQTPS